MSARFWVPTPRPTQSIASIVWTSFAELFHQESARRGLDLAPAAAARFQSEIDTMRERWGPVLDNGLFYGPVFDNRFSNYRPADEPRRVPWMRESAVVPVDLHVALR